MIPFTRVDLLALFIHSGCENKFDYLHVVDDGFWRKPRVRHLLDELPHRSVRNVREQLISEIRQEPRVECISPARNGSGFDRTAFSSGKRSDPAFGLLTKSDCRSRILAERLGGIDSFSLEIITKTLTRYGLRAADA